MRETEKERDTEKERERERVFEGHVSWPRNRNSCCVGAGVPVHTQAPVVLAMASPSHAEDRQLDHVQVHSHASFTVACVWVFYSSH